MTKTGAIETVFLETAGSHDPEDPLINLPLTINSTNGTGATINVTVNYAIKDSEIKVVSGGSGYEAYNSLVAPYLEFLPLDPLDEMPEITIDVDPDTGAITNIECYAGGFFRTPTIAVRTQKVTNVNDIITQLTNLDEDLSRLRVVESLESFLQANVVTENQNGVINDVIAQLLVNV